MLWRRLIITYLLVLTVGSKSRAASLGHRPVIIQVSCCYPSTPAAVGCTERWHHFLLNFGQSRQHCFLVAVGWCVQAFIGAGQTVKTTSQIVGWKLTGFDFESSSCKPLHFAQLWLKFQAAWAPQRIVRDHCRTFCTPQGRPSGSNRSHRGRSTQAHSVLWHQWSRTWKWRSGSSRRYLSKTSGWPVLRSGSVYQEKSYLVSIFRKMNQKWLDINAYDGDINLFGDKKQTSILELKVFRLRTNQRLSI